MERIQKCIHVVMLHGIVKMERFFELTIKATCSFRIWGNSLLKWGKRGIGYSEVRKLLNGDDVAVRLFSYNSKKEYFKYIALDKDYGVSVLWDLEVEDDEVA
jgi:hypothetical protein